MKRVLFVGRTRYARPLALTHERKFAALGAVLDLRVVGTAGSGSGDLPRFTLIDGHFFYARAPFVVARELRSFRPDAIIAQSPYEGLVALVARRLARSRTKVIVEIHGDWTTASRYYGSPLRKLIGPLADKAAEVAVRRADAVRTVSGFTAGMVRALGVEPKAIFHTYSELHAFVDRPTEPLPVEGRLAFVGVLERYKNIDGLARAWRIAAPRVPGVTLELVGDGHKVETVEVLVRDVPGQTIWHRRLEPAEVSALLDRSWALVLPSFSEGLPRVAVESLLRGRPVIGSTGGGIPDAVHDGENGLLVPVGEVQPLADAIVRFCTDAQLRERLAAGARPSAEAFLVPPEEYARRVAALVESA
ncbi:MAG TPA: glycosyltransferase family 4 protein [Gaiellaceae bacterium]|nr:glycosyltransferase family 4 protein [Gaiellaceae bacterium]